MFKITLTGKPNVGKSSLFNLLLKKNQAVVAAESGVTRDTLCRVVQMGRCQVELTDCGGLGESFDVLKEKVQQKAWQAVQNADLAVLVADAHLLNEEDRMLIKIFQKKKIPFLVCVNKVDREADAPLASEIFKYGVRDPVFISCKYKKNISILRSRLITHCTRLKPSTVPRSRNLWTKTPALKVAVLGRPNSGKSTLVNLLLKKERVIISELPGTTRDSIEDFFMYKKKCIQIVDTAGLRRRKRKKGLLENLSIPKSIAAIQQSDIVVLLIEATETIAEQDKKIASVAVHRNKPLILLISKWDLQKEQHWTDYASRIRFLFPHLGHVPLLNISCKTKKNISKFLDLLLQIHSSSLFKASTAELNKVLQAAIKKNPPQRGSLKFYTDCSWPVRP